MQFRLNSL